MEMLKQDSRDNVPPNHPDVTFYTNPNIRSIIDKILNDFICHFLFSENKLLTIKLY